MYNVKETISLPLKARGACSDAMEVGGCLCMQLQGVFYHMEKNCNVICNFAPSSNARTKIVSCTLNIM
eukprot:10313653-Ditylum_brightwellii.AAC.1